MKLTCALCGRSMNEAAVLIGHMPVGPKCAKRAGLVELGRKKSGAVSLLAKRTRGEKGGETMDLFEEEQ